MSVKMKGKIFCLEWKLYWINERRVECLGIEWYQKRWSAQNAHVFHQLFSETIVIKRLVAMRSK